MNNKKIKQGWPTDKERSEKIKEYMKLSKMDLAILLFDTKISNQILSGDRKIKPQV